MTPELLELIREVAKNSPFAAIAIVAILIVYKLAEQKVQMALDMADRHKEMADQRKEIAGQYKELCDSSQTWGQQWILALSQNTQAFNANMKVMAETRDVIGGMRELLAKEKKPTAKAK